MTELERLQEAKIPCKETGIEVKHTFCSVCEPLFHCGIDAYVKDGRVVKIEGTPDYPVSNGNLCPKGHANRQYIYRADRCAGRVPGAAASSRRSPGRRLTGRSLRG